MNHSEQTGDCHMSTSWSVNPPPSTLHRYIYGVLDCAMPQQWPRIAFVYALHWLSFLSLLALSWLKGHFQARIDSKAAEAPGTQGFHSVQVDSIPRDSGAGTGPSNRPAPGLSLQRDMSGFVGRSQGIGSPAVDPHLPAGLHVAKAVQLGALRMTRGSRTSPGKHRLLMYRA